MKPLSTGQEGGYKKGSSGSLATSPGYVKPLRNPATAKFFFSSVSTFLAW
jgi:hypothetical protein